MRSLLSCLFICLFLTSCATTRQVQIDATNKGVKQLGEIRVALVLGGGGSRGIAHLGVIEVLQENNIPIDLIVGSSIGSAVGALYADSKDTQKLKNILFKARRDELLDFSFADLLRMFNSPTLPIRGQAYENFIYHNLTAKNFSELKIPLVVVTVDAKTGKRFIINDGPIAPAVRASSAIPPIIAPVKIYDRTLFDGGVLEPVPVATAKLFKPEFIIAVDINNLPPEILPNNVFNLTYKAFWLEYYQLSRIQAAQADIDIHPDLSGHGVFEDHRKEELYLLGRNAALNAIANIKKKLAEISR